MTTSPAATRGAIDHLDTRLSVGGVRRDAATGRTFGVENPATGEIVCEVADANAADALDALDAAAAAQDGWAATAPRERSEILRRAHDALVARTDEIAELITLEMGKSLAESRGEVAYGADFLRWYAEEAVRIAGEWRVNGAGDGRILTMRQPVGPCLLITPWNVPLAMPTRKIGPAIAAGCAMILKPAEQTPLTALLVADVLAEAGLPDGVLSVLPTSDPAPVSDVLMRDPRLRKVSFTGSTEVGRLLLEKSAGTVLRTSMELGGNAPFVVCADADVDAAVAGAMIAKMRNIGEACIAANRFLVHADVVEEFATKLAARMGSLDVGDGNADGPRVGPLIDAAARDKVAGLVADATASGARTLVGGTVPDGAGYFYPPTVVTDVPPSARINREEIFGPVASLSVFHDEDDAIRRANDTPAGLIAYLFTRDVGRAVRLAERLHTGMVGLNRGYVSDASAPFGGVKQSGLGREGGSAGIAEYLETKYVAFGL
ncbi:NAD-dependent succinate-semialdehyde dehydrogenase [Pseudonocardia endophytica]|uniref:Succinate-semialdehyde dehydrogenase/glutarate-semialdehyde dehydrogenase n=1 Tax=Pseudonocardia endophytica TaxID=401976 RepID=A0A4R1I958_PSEEN|nr:NAD-dependent succinate-semialdehyde dehydrogenase [Pseudonocardia endophytica]TCK26752.1 succinate-semialdehyde dehydrogenase/glutarate-semialdehyde dehydrogenase [Pseudonocardia endophytica]